MSSANVIDADPAPVARSVEIVSSYPQLMRGYASVSREWVERMAFEVRRNDGNDDRFRSRVIGAAIMGVIDAALAEWIDGGADQPISTFVLAGLDHIEPLLAGHLSPDI